MAAAAERADQQVEGRAGRLIRLGPAGLYYVLFFALPLAILFGISFWRMDGFQLAPDLTFDNYGEGITSSLYQAVLIRTLLVGLAAAALVVPVAYILAYLMRFVLEKRAQLILELVLLSLFSGYLVRIYAWRTVLGREGILNSVLLQLGLVEEPLGFLIFSPWSVVITLFGLLLPVALLPIYSALCNVSREHLEAARDLGSGTVHCHRTIVIPMILPGLRVAFAFAFLLAAGDFVVPALVGGTQGLMIGNVIADQFRGIGSNWPLGAALSFLVLGTVTVLYIAFMRLLGWATRW